MGTTISTHIGQTVADNHNLRRGNFRNADHIDPNGKFEVWTYTSLEKHFENCFGDAIAKYNQGKKPSRQIKNYLKDIKDNPKTVPQYEMIVQVGGTFSPFGSDTPEEPVCEEILKEFYEEFQKEFPTMVVRSACYHADEATPHLHLDYTPVAPNMGERGPELVCSQTKALKALGLNNKEFTAKANQLLEDICVKHGIDVIHPYRDAGIKGKHLGTDDYKRFQHAVNQFTTARLEATEIVERTQLSDLEDLDEVLTTFKNYNARWKDKAHKEKDPKKIKYYDEQETKINNAEFAVDDMLALKKQIEKIEEYKQVILELVPDYDLNLPVQSQVEAPEM